jgi:agmatinase
LNHYDFELGGPLLNEGDIHAVDCGDISGDPSDPQDNCKRTTDTVRAIIDAGAIPIVLGGDDSVPIPVFRAFERCGPLTVVQVDAHIDWRDAVNGVTEGYSSTMRRASELPWIGKLIQVGMRGTGSARREEVEAAKAYGVEFITAKEVQDRGVGYILNRIPDGAACLVTIDCDGLDPSIMPAVLAPAPGGLTYRHITDLLHGLSKKASVAGFDIVELVPERDVNKLGAWTAARIICNLIGALVRSKRIIRKVK